MFARLFNLYQSEKIHSGIADKWVIESGRIVEAVMHGFVLKLDYQHPSCSVILDLSDETYNELYTAEELDEIEQATTSKDDVEFPLAMKNFLDAIPKTTNLRDVFLHLNNQTFDPFANGDLYWLKNSLQ
ncbi:unnamed protein product [Mucor hiemalis]